MDREREYQRAQRPTEEQARVLRTVEQAGWHARNEREHGRDGDQGADERRRIPQAIQERRHQAELRSLERAERRDDQIATPAMREARHAKTPAGPPAERSAYGGRGSAHVWPPTASSRVIQRSTVAA